VDSDNRGGVGYGCIVEVAMILLNFSRKLNHDQKEQVEALSGLEIERAYTLELGNFQGSEPYQPQIKQAFERFPFDPDFYHSYDILVNLPNSGPLAVLVLVELHHRMGRYPKILRMGILPVINTMLLPHQDVQEVIDLGG